MGAEAWTGEGPEEDRGLVVLGVPVGHRAFCAEVVGRGHGRLWPNRLLAKPTLAKPTLANVNVLVVCKDFGFWELIVWVF